MVRKVISIRHMPAAQGAETVVGRTGVAIGAGLTPDGVVRVASEEWRAITSDGPRSRRRAGAGSPGSTDSCSPSTAIAAEHEAAATVGGRGREEPLMDISPALIGMIVVVLFVVLFLAKAIKIVPEYQRLVVFRLGRLLGQKGPGLVILIPFVDKGITVDLREFYLEIPRQDSITKDNAPIAVDFVMFYKVLDAQMSVVQVGELRRRRAQHRLDHAARGDRRHPARRHARQARRDQHACCASSSTRSPSAGA